MKVDTLIKEFVNKHPSARVYVSLIHESYSSTGKNEWCVDIQATFGNNSINYVKIKKLTMEEAVKEAIKAWESKYIGKSKNKQKKKAKATGKKVRKKQSKASSTKKARVKLKK